MNKTNLVFVQNEGIFVQLDEFEKLNNITQTQIRIHSQCHTITDNRVFHILVLDLVELDELVFI